MIEAVPDLKPFELKYALVKTAVRLPHVEVDRQGWGMVNPRGAIAYAMRMRGITHHSFAEEQPMVISED